MAQKNPPTLTHLNRFKKSIRIIRLRPVLTLATWVAGGGSGAEVVPRRSRCPWDAPSSAGTRAASGSRPCPWWSCRPRRRRPRRRRQRTRRRCSGCSRCHCGERGATSGGCGWGTGRIRGGRRGGTGGRGERKGGGELEESKRGKEEEELKEDKD